MKIIEMYKVGKLQNKNLKKIIIPKEYDKKCNLYSILVLIILLIPLLIIFASLFQIISFARIAFLVISLVGILLLLAIFSFQQLFCIILLREYLETDGEKAVQKFQQTLDTLNSSLKEEEKIDLSAFEIIEIIESVKLGSLFLYQWLSFWTFIFLLLFTVGYFILKNYL